MRLSNVYIRLAVYAVVYHTQPNSEEVEFVRPKIFSSAKKAKDWFDRKFRYEDFIQPEVVELSNLNCCQIRSMKNDPCTWLDQGDNDDD
jgi:hypothetical protein